MSAISVWRIGFCPSPPPDSKVLLMEQGFGSTLGEGRWHSRTGRQMVYAGSSRAICHLEKRVHANGAAIKNQALMRLDLPDDAVLLDAVSDLHLDPDRLLDIATTRRVGDDWLLAASSLGLWVPSVVENLENNLLLNPAHPQYTLIELTVERNPFTFDLRLFS